jgi:hypothetical protein
MAAISVHERLRIALLLLEQADEQAIKAKQQVARILGEDPQPGAEIARVYSVFKIDKHEYRALLTVEQHDRIADVISQGNNAKEVLTEITDKIFLHLYESVDVAFNALVAGLQNQDPTQQIKQNAGTLGANSLQHQDRTQKISKNSAESAANSPPQTLLVSCDFGATCKDNYSRTLCVNQGGNPVPACTREGQKGKKKTPSQ